MENWTISDLIASLCLMCSLHSGPQVVALKFQNRINSMVWADRGLSLITGLYITICQFHNQLEVEFLPAHTPSSEEIDNLGERREEREGGNGYYLPCSDYADLFAENVRSELSLATSIPLSSYSIEDMLLCRAADSLGLPYHAGLVSFPTVQRELR